MARESILESGTPGASLPGRAVAPAQAFHERQGPRPGGVHLPSPQGVQETAPRPASNGQSCAFHFLAYFILKHKSQTVQISLLKCTVQVSSTLVMCNPHYQIPERFLHPEGVPCFAVGPILCRSPCGSPLCFVSLRIYL